MSPLEVFGFIDPSRFDGSKDGRSCPVEYHAEILPLHRFDLPNAPVSAWKVRILGGSLRTNDHVEWWGPRREELADAIADLAELTGAAA